MPEIICDMQTLNECRPTFLATCLSAVSPVQPYVYHRSGPNQSLLVASYGAQNTRSERERSFPSNVDSIECRYMERWLAVGNTDQERRLRNTYFHLFRQEGPEERPKELFAFHWEPVVGDELDHGHAYRQRPHFHMSFGPDPLPRSHFVVTLTVGAGGQDNVDYLNGLLDEVVKMVNAEVLELILSRPNGW